MDMVGEASRENTTRLQVASHEEVRPLNGLYMLCYPRLLHILERSPYETGLPSKLQPSSGENIGVIGNSRLHHSVPEDRAFLLFYPVIHGRIL